MNQRDVTQSAARILLVAGLLAINAFPFGTNTKTSYETIFFSLSAIHAELCLLTAWGIFVEKRGRLSRLVWILLGMTAAFIAATRLLSGKWTTLVPWSSLMLGVAATLPALLPMAAVFATQRYCTGTELVPDSATNRPFRRIRLKQLFALIAGCAFLSLLLRLTIKTPDGWLVSPGDAGNYVLGFVQSFVMGLLAAPCALVILKPNRFSVLWLVYFGAIAALQPFLELMIKRTFDRPVGLPANAWIWPESYLTIVIDNITWYGPQLLPTVLLFVTLRLSGVRVQEKK